MATVTETARRGRLAAAIVLLAVGAGGCREPMPSGAEGASVAERRPGGADVAPDPRCDPDAVRRADAVMARLGGRAAWDATRYLAWDFFGRRRHVWDKHTGDVRIEGADEDGAPYVILMNVVTRAGRAWVGGEEVTDAERLAARLDAGYRAWINDSYWLVMPYKLRDPGVILRSAGTRSMLDGRAADVLALTFDDVGVTPQNRYDVYVARDTGLVEQWDFYADAADAEPRFRTPWGDWRRHGRIMLSGDRGEDRRLTGIATYDDLPAAVLRSPAPWSAP